MAMIKCPECGSEISSNAGHCVKCGCKITCCPDCNKVFIGEAEVCDGCGYIFKNTEKKNSETSVEKQVKGIAKIIDADRRIYNIFRVINVIFLISILASIAIGIAVYTGWDKNESVAKLFKLNSTFNSLKAITIIACILFALYIAQGYLYLMLLTLHDVKSIRKLNVDHRVIAGSGNLFAGYGKAGEKYSKNIKRAIYLNENQQNLKWYIMPEIMSVIFNIVVASCFAVWVVDNLKVLFAAKFLDMPFGLGDLDYAAPLFICAIIFFVLACILDLARPIRDKKVKNWSQGISRT